MHVSVPGSILLLGEYAVLEEGGLGLAMAVERRVQISSAPAESLSIHGAWPGGSSVWTPRDASASPLITAVVGAVEKWLREPDDRKISWGVRITVDSSALFSVDGRKSGLGSSAAVTAGLVFALLRAAGRRSTSTDDAVLPLAIRAHRAAQGGVGSGYDVSTSFHGGMGIFHGGALPLWEPCRLREDPVVFLFPGPSPVSTSESIRRYALWKKTNPDDARAFLEESNRNVGEFVRARSAAEAALWLRACRDLGITLGRSIGVPAEIRTPSGLEASSCKALGAGNELGACIMPRGSAAPLEDELIRRVTAGAEGMAWEE
jgi:phosphomevalonate kinase